MKMFKKIAAACALLAGTFSQAQADAEQDRFNKYINMWDHPQIMHRNPIALDTRLEMLDVVPAGSTVKVLTFVWDNGESTRELAAHICRAARRGVSVQVMADSKFVGKPGFLDIFEKPVTDEVFQYMANCGAQVRVHNYLPDILKVVAGKAIPALKYVKGDKSKLASGEKLSLAQVAVNRLNHRKLFYVQSKGGPTCIVMGGRNLGDHYLSWHHDSFLDTDIIYCNHHGDEIKRTRPQDNSNQILAGASASFDSLWTDKESSAGVQVTVLPIEKNLNYKFKHVYLAKETTRQWGNEKVVTRRESNDPEFALVKNDGVVKDAKDAKNEDRGEIPVARPVPKNDGIKSRSQELSYGWRFATTTWNPKEDNVRANLYNMIAREQAEIFIESAYVEYDSKMQDLLKTALDRGVDVTIIANSWYVSDGPSKLISLTRAPWTTEAQRVYGANVPSDFKEFSNSREMAKNYIDATGPGRFAQFVTTAYAGHMIHFKGAGFKCQASEDGKSFKKSFLIGSHNFHVRSGLADKEHALIWDEPVDFMCINVVGQNKFDKKFIEEVKARYIEKDVVNGLLVGTLHPKNRDMIEDRIRFYNQANFFFLQENRPLLYSFKSLSAELAQDLDPKNETSQSFLNKTLAKGIKWTMDRVIYKTADPEKTPELTLTGRAVVGFLNPMLDWIDDFL